MAAFMRHIVGQRVAGSSGNVQDHQSNDSDAEGCIFCLRDDSELNQIACENSGFFARYDNFPAADGHLEIVPKRHVESFFDLSMEEITEAYSLLLEARCMLDGKYNPDGYTIGINEGTAAGRSIDHLHIHLIPRHEGDVADPRGGIRRAAPNCDPDSWASDAAKPSQKSDLR
ncbi:HIT family protein [Actinoallomurus sp. NPDC052274]|uniref:HIT family protein n=1 Tax=Actinoallomurus sp. NPDC052274 TaxID=3155420 RepID=UPI0034309E34